MAGAAPFVRRIPLAGDGPAKPIRFAVITDLHHGLAPDALARLKDFVDAIKERDGLQFVVQMGDFNYSLPASQECVDLFSSIQLPKIHVLGNHDMDKCDKEHAMRFWGMPSRYGTHHFSDTRFIALDLNHYRTKEGRLLPYDSGNYYSGVSHGWADPGQLRWLTKELRQGTTPTILLSHYPIGFAEPGKPMPPEQQQILDVIEDARKENPRGAVQACLFGHLHVDRLEYVGKMPCLCVNSASYFWYQGMNPYTNPLFAFMELTTDGSLVVEGTVGHFVKPPPKASGDVIGRSASISKRKISLA